MEPAEHRDDPVLNIMGEHVALGPFDRDTVLLLYRWGNDPTVRRTFDFPDAWMLERMTDEFARLTDSEHDAFFVLYERLGVPSTQVRRIGFTYLTGIDFRHRTAEFGIMIGEAGARGKGRGTEATRLMLDYAFGTLGLHNIMLRVSSENRAGIRAYEKAGFREFARRRACKWMGGVLWDEVLMQCLTPLPLSNAHPL